MNKNIPSGFAEAGSWSEQGQVVSVPAGAGIAATAHTVLVSREIPSSARVYIEKIFMRVVDMAAYDQLYFSLRRNGALLAPWHKISAEQVVEEFDVEVGEVFGGGQLEIVAANISGTSVATESSVASDPVAVRCIARIKGTLLRELPAFRG